MATLERDMYSVGTKPGTSEQPAIRAGGAGSDTDLVDAVLAGDRDAFRLVLARYDDRLRGLAYRLLADRHRMEDALQEAYVRAYVALPRFRRDADLGSWLYRITYNACIDELRRAKRRPEPIDLSEPGRAELGGRGTGPEGAVVAADQVTRALAALPDDQRLTVVLVDGEGFDNHTAAQILGVAPGTVGSRLSRARSAMRAALERGEDRDA